MPEYEFFWEEFLKFHNLSDINPIDSNNRTLLALNEKRSVEIRIGKFKLMAINDNAHTHTQKDNSENVC